MLLLGEIVKNRYIVTSLIARGSTGRVYLAEDMKTRVPVAIKTSKDTLVLREATTISHEKVMFDVLSGVPGIPKVQDFFLRKLFQMFVFPYLGKSIQHICVTRGGFLTHRDACRMGISILDTLQGVHERGVLHLDVKPANILFDGSYHLVDFGSARFMDAGPDTDAEDLDSPDEEYPFISRRVEKGEEPNIIDDYESLMYTICAVAGELPWLNEDWSHVAGRVRTLKKRYRGYIGYGFPDAFKTAWMGVVKRSTNFAEMKQLLSLAVSQAEESEK